MTQSTDDSPLSTPAPWNLVATGYETENMPFLAKFAKNALELIEPAASARVIDVAAGPGTLTFLAARRVAEVHAIDFSTQMLALLERRAKVESVTNVWAYTMDGQALEFGDEEFDCGFSMFGLMFFPDRARGFGELYRVLKPGGRVAVSSWAPIDRSPAIKTIFGAMRAIAPDMPEPRKDVPALESSDGFERELRLAGFGDVEIHHVTHEVEVASPEDAWDSMTRGCAPLAMMRTRYDDEAWEAKRAIAIEYLEQNLPRPPAQLGAEALIGIGTR